MRRMTSDAVSTEALANAMQRILENPADQLAWQRVLGLLEGVGPATVARLTDELGVAEHVDLDGMLSREDVATRMRAADVLVLPAHGRPFRGAHERIDAIAAEHGRRLERLHEHLDEPRRAVDVFGVLYRRRVPASHRVMATGEAIAHLHYLVGNGDAVAEQDAAGVIWYSRN